MTLGNMRHLGVQHLVATCLKDACRHQGLIDVSKYPDDVEAPRFGSKVVCAKSAGPNLAARPPLRGQPFLLCRGAPFGYVFRLLILGAVRGVCLSEGKSLLADATPRTFPAARSSDQSRSRARPLGVANKGLVPNDAPSPGEAAVRLPMHSDRPLPRLRALDPYPFLPVRSEVVPETDPNRMEGGV
jgi:hypothetical protein